MENKLSIILFIVRVIVAN